MNLRAAPQAYSRIECHPWMDPAILADPTARANHRVRANLRAGADMRIFTNHSVRPYAGVRRNPRERRHDRRWMKPRGNRRASKQQLRGTREGDLGLRAPQNRLAWKLYAFSRNHTDRSRSRRPLRVLRGVNVNQTACTSTLWRGDTRQFESAVAFEFPAD